MNQIVTLEAARSRPDQLRRQAPPRRRGPGRMRRAVARLAIRIAEASDPSALAGRSARDRAGRRIAPTT